MTAFDTYRVLRPTDILTAITSNELNQEIQACLEAGIRTILIDLQKVSFIDSSGLGVLVSNHTKLRLAGGKLYFCAPQAQALSLFDIADVDSIFTILNTEQEFLSLLVKRNQAVLVQ
jgi:anti-anti-sigma factor